MSGIETYKLGDFPLQSGEKIKDAFIAYRTFGDPKSPVIVYPSWFSYVFLFLVIGQYPKHALHSTCGKIDILIC